MNNLATLILLGLLTGAAAPASALEPMRGAPPPAADTGPQANRGHGQA